jgi:hypothetical protein
MSEIAINAPNLWRLETPGHTGWERTAHADGPKKYFIVSTDSHANEPPDLWEKRIDPPYRERVPRIITDEKGVQWRYCEGYRPDRVRVMSFEGEDWVRSRAGADVVDRIRDNRTDGVDVEIIFPNKGLAMWATPDPVFANAQCRVWNDPGSRSADHVPRLYRARSARGARQWWGRNQWFLGGNCG